MSMKVEFHAHDKEVKFIKFTEENIPLFHPVVRPDVLRIFQEECKSESTIITNLLFVTNELNKYLVNQKTKKANKVSELNIKARGHFMNALVSISQGFIVDAMGSIRSALEDLLIILNIYHKNRFLNNWTKKGRDFYLKVTVLLDSNQIRNEHKKALKSAYGELSKLLHSTSYSLYVSQSFHPSYKTVNNSEILKRYSGVFVLLHSMFNYVLIDLIHSKIKSGIFDHILNQLNDIMIPYILNE